MAKTVRPDPQGQSESSDENEQILQVRAYLEYGRQSWYPNKVYAIADGGADSCIVGKYAKVLSYTGRYANLVGYNPETTRTEKVPIVTALIKTKSTTSDGISVLLKIHEAPYNSTVLLHSYLHTKSESMVLSLTQLLQNTCLHMEREVHRGLKLIHGLKSILRIGEV